MTAEAPAPDLAGRRILVTGGTGFIGGRLVERLVRDCGAEVRLLVHTMSRAARVARFPVELVQGDVTDAEAVAGAVDGCDVVYHFATTVAGNEERVRAVTVDGTRNVLEAARGAGVRRLVNMSSIQVYGAPPDGDLDETAPRDYQGDIYTRIKLDAEDETLRYGKEHGLPTVVIQPTIVYGPYSASWTMRVLGDLQRGAMILVDGGQGLCNAVYVDDLVDALLLAAVRDEAVGEAFLISGAEPVTWRTFYGRHAAMLGGDRLVEMTADEAKALFAERTTKKRTGVFREMVRIIREEPPVRRRVAQTREVDALRKLARVVVPRRLRRSARAGVTGAGKAAPGNGPPAGGEEPQVQLMGPAQIDFHAAKVHVRIDKARRLLGYAPRFDFETGMKLTESWARWAGLLESP